MNLWPWCVVLSMMQIVFAAPAKAQDVTRSLSEFGGLGTAAEAQATFERALQQLTEQGGGVLVIPGDAPTQWTARNISQGVWRQPAAPAPAATWGDGPGVTVVDQRGGRMKVLVPQVTGIELTRHFNLPPGDSSPHWRYHPMLQMTNSITRGSTSYLEWLQDDVAEGSDQRFYMNTIRGVFPGMFLNAHRGPGYSGAVSRIYVKTLGYDADRQMPYFTADVDQNIVKGAIIHNKTHTNVLRADTYAHTENQTFDIMMWRHQYSQGDSYLIDAQFHYMGDVHSTVGDENGVLYAAFVINETNIFRGQVEAYDPQTAELKYTKASNAHTLGSGRPIINLNPQKWITGDDLLIVRPATWWGDEATSEKDGVLDGKTYPTKVEESRIGTMELRMGGLMRFAVDSKVNQDVVGRYIAIDEPDELVPGGSHVRRWYMIHDVNENADGTKTMRIVRYWWGAKPAASPTLYNPDNYSRDGHIKPLTYIIAPGANAYDVSRGVLSGTEHSGGALEHTIVLSPGPHTGSPHDFGPGDAIEQAIGPDPFKPVPFRSWVWDHVPGAWPSPIFDVSNEGPISRHAVMTVGGGPSKIDELAARADKLPPWEYYFRFNSAASQGLLFDADVVSAAIQFNQPNNRAQPIKWIYGEDRQEATLTVSPQTGVMTFDGGGIAAPGGLTQVRGLSGTQTPANNLRGIRVAVPAGSQSIVVPFPRQEADDQYAVFVELSWLTIKAITKQNTQGFTVTFENPPDQDGFLHWMLVR